MRVSPLSALLSAGLAAALGLAAVSSLAAGPVGFVALKEHGVGSAAQAQPFLEKLVEAASKENGWSGYKTKYFTSRGDAEGWIDAEKPSYGILSLAPFLALKAKYNLEPIGQASVASAGGQQYFLISKSAGDLAGCKGKRLASDHADDPKFIDKVVSGGKFKLGDFTLVQTTRPLQTTKKVIGDEAECALIDDAQLAELPKVDPSGAVKQVWASDKLPALVMVAFSTAPAAERAAFQTSLPKICQGAGAQACSQVGIQGLKSASAADYAALVTAYTK